jgi:hypothetical protein
MVAAMWPITSHGCCTPCGRMACDRPVVLARPSAQALRAAPESGRTPTFHPHNRLPATPYRHHQLGKSVARHGHDLQIG